MDGWRKPKRKALALEDPPALNVTSERVTRTSHAATNARAGAPTVDDLQASSPSNDRDLSLFMRGLRKDLDDASAFFAAQSDPKHRAHDEFRRKPGALDITLLRTQDALLCASEKVTRARRERDEARVEMRAMEASKTHAVENWMRAAELERNAVAELAEARKKLEAHARKKIADVRDDGNDGNDGAMSSTGATVATLARRAETAERLLSSTREELKATEMSLEASSREVRTMERASRLARTARESDALRIETLERTVETLKGSLIEEEARNATLERRVEVAERSALEVVQARDAATKNVHAEIEALRGAAAAAGIVAETAERARQSAVTETDRAQNETERLRESSRVAERELRSARERRDGYRDDLAREKKKSSLLENKLRLVETEVRAMDEATRHLLGLVRNDRSSDATMPFTLECSESAGARRVRGDDDSENERPERRRGGGASFAALDASLEPAASADVGEAVGVAWTDGNGHEPAVSVHADSVPASAEAAPGTAPVPTSGRRAPRRRAAAAPPGRSKLRSE